METLRNVSAGSRTGRFETALLGFFAVTGLVMAVIGLYGVIAYMAVQRTCRRSACAWRWERDAPTFCD
jgi:hypothetical protein